MTRKNVARAVVAVLVLGLIAVVAAACGGGAEMNLTETADAIRSGEIDVGDDYGLDVGKRFHEIHTTALGLGCETCHGDGVSRDTTLAAWNESPQSPGPVDRRGCLGCHSGGLGNAIYGAED